ncbi:MAG: hypothetical protein ACK54K_02815, partial [Gemmatimonadaceae bacterium]
MTAALSPLPPDAPGALRAQHREALTRQVQAVVAGGRTAGPPWGTGLTALDAAVGGGIPRGRLTELTGPLAVGKTTLLRQVVARVLHTGSWVAWIDAGRTLAPAPWADLGERFVVIRLPEPRRAAWTADLLLRSGVFGLVVLDGAPPLSRVHGVRLAQLARERDAACVVLAHDVPGGPRVSRLAGTVRVRMTLDMPPSMQAQWPRGPHRHRRPLVVAESVPVPDPAPAAPRMVVTVEKGGQGNRNQTIEVDRVIVVARRVCADSEIPDRRGVARSARRPWTARGNSTDTGADADQRPQAHPVTWGGLGVAAHDLYGTDVPGHPARLAAGLDDPGDRTGDRTGDRGQLDQALDRRTRDWTTYRGRRRAAESGFGRRGRRELAR